MHKENQIPALIWAPLKLDQRSLNAAGLPPPDNLVWSGPTRAPGKLLYVVWYWNLYFTDLEAEVSHWVLYKQPSACGSNW